MLTQQQEDYLKALADKGIAEQDEIDNRNTQILLDAKIQAARADKLVELQTQAQDLIDAGLDAFEANEVPNIK